MAQSYEKAGVNLEAGYEVVRRIKKHVASTSRLGALVEGSSRQKTPNEIALTILLAGFTIVFVIVCATESPGVSTSGS